MVIFAWGTCIFRGGRPQTETNLAQALSLSSSTSLRDEVRSSLLGVVVSRRVWLGY